MTASLDAMRTELKAVMQGGSRGLHAANELCATCVSLFGVDGAAVSVVFGGASSGTFGSSSETSRRLDEYQFTFGEGPCLDAVASRNVVLVPDLDSPQEQRWPGFSGALLSDGIRGVFALPIMITSECVGALDLFRARPGPLEGDALAGARLAAELASMPLLELIADATGADGRLDGRAVPGRADRDRPLPPTAEDEPGPLEEIDRIEVYQATGMLIAALDVDAAEALVRLRAHAIATGQTASQVAQAIVERKLMLERDERHGRDDAGGGRRDPL